MMIHDITSMAGKYKARKRVGRGLGSGSGKTAGRGYKGAGSRSGTARKTAFEGGQMPYFRRIRKFGFSNAKFTTHFWIVNLRDILAHESLKKGGEISAETLIKAGLIRDTSRDLKILGDTGEIQKLGVKFTINAARVSAKARILVEEAGGKVTETGSRRDRVRGIDRNSDDKSPKNLTKKLNRGSKSKGKAAVAAAAAGESAGVKSPAPKGKGDGEGKPSAEGKKSKPAPPSAE
ncbi:MAG: 50S ribosomal protein L15 [Phycisphaerales bacterium]|nr:50S ribosomal protein L15 [Phycisphaerales bacterium]